MMNDKNNKNFINASTPYGISISIVLIIGVLFVVKGYEKIGFLMIGASCFALLIFLMLFIPKAQKIQITDKALIISAYRYQRSYFWDQIYDVYLKTQQRENTTRVIIKISKNSVNDMDSKIVPYMEVPIDANAFGQDVKDLYKKIKNKIQQNIT
jgi:hypothetical protein